MKKRVLVICDSLEDAQWRGIDFIALNIIDALKDSDYEIGYLSSVPYFSLYGEEIDKQIYLFNIQHALKHGITTIYNNYKLQRKRNFEIFKIKHIFKNYARYISLQNIQFNNYTNFIRLLKKVDFVLSYPFFSKAMKLQDKRFLSEALKNIVKKYSFEYIIVAHPSTIKNQTPSKLIHFFHDIMPIDIVEEAHSPKTIDTFSNNLVNSIHSSDGFLFNSIDTQRKILNLFHKNVKKSAVVGSFVNLKDYHDHFSQIRLTDKDYFVSLKASLGIKNDIIISFVSSLEDRKNTISLLNSLPYLNEKLKDRITLVIMGKYSHNSEILKQFELKKEHKKIQIILTGYISELDKITIIKNSKALVFPTVYEGLGLPVIEAMSLGTLVISTNRGGLSEVVNQDNAFIINDPYNCLEIAERIMEAINATNEVINKKIQSAFKHIQENYSYTSFKTKIINFLESL